MLYDNCLTVVFGLSASEVHFFFNIFGTFDSKTLLLCRQQLQKSFKSPLLVHNPYEVQTLQLKQT